MSINWSERLHEGAAEPVAVHLIGVAGSGMSGLASLLLGLGHKVSGSDRVASKETARLERRRQQRPIEHRQAFAHSRDAEGGPTERAPTTRRQAHVGDAHSGKEGGVAVEQIDQRSERIEGERGIES